MNRNEEVLIKEARLRDLMAKLGLMGSFKETIKF